MNYDVTKKMQEALADLMREAFPDIPVYTDEPMSTNERDTHFKKSADLLFPEVSKRFFTMYARIEEHRPIEEIDALEDEIETLIAQYAYDLLQSACIDINNEQMRTGVRLHPNAMLRAVKDLDVSPPTTVE